MSLLTMDYPNKLFSLVIVSMSFCVMLSLPVTSEAGSPDRIEIYTYGPGIAQVTDVYGRRSGRDLTTGDALEEIPRSAVEREGTKDRIPGWTVHIENPTHGVYRIKLLATGSGAFAIDVDTVDIDGNLINHHLFRRVRTGDTIDLMLTYSSEPGTHSTLIDE